MGNLGNTRGGVGKSGVLKHKSDNKVSETRKGRGKVTTVGLLELTNAYSNRTIPDPHGLFFPNIGGSQPHPKTQKSNRYYLKNG